MTGEALDTFLNETMAELESALEEALNPDPYEHLCYAYAVELYAMCGQDVLPYAGGPMEQPSFEMYVLECMRTAHDRAQRETRAAEAKMRAAERAEAEAKAINREYYE